MFLLMGLAKITVSVFGYLNPRIRMVEDELPNVLLDKEP
jgi:hypothetical protein